MKLKFLQPLSLVLLSGIFLTACQSFVGCHHGDVSCFRPHPSSYQSPPQLNPEYNYMRVMFNGQVAWLAQGATDMIDHIPQQVYYSADKNIFKWSQGRLSAVEHSAFSWREHQLPIFDWQYMLDQPNSFTRQLDLTDGTLSVEEQREIQPSTAPEYHAFIGDSSNLIWLHERTEDVQAEGTHFDSWFALQPDSLEPVYGQQCISIQHCITWQKWNMTQHETVEQK